MAEAESEELRSQLRRLASEKVWLEIHEADLGPDDPIIAEMKINLAECYFQQCQYKDAEVLYKQVLTQSHEKKFGPINGDNKSIWQVAEDREENKGINDNKRVPYAELGAWLKDAKGSAVTIALGKLKTLYQQQGKDEAVKTPKNYELGRSNCLITKNKFLKFGEIKWWNLQKNYFVSTIKKFSQKVLVKLFFTTNPASS